MTLQLAAHPGPQTGAERVDANPARNGGSAAANAVGLPAPSVVDRARELQAAEAAYAQALSHAMRARTVEQVRQRFDLADQRAVELRVLARRAR